MNSLPGLGGRRVGAPAAHIACSSGSQVDPLRGGPAAATGTKERPGDIPRLFDPDRLTTDGMPRDCPMCDGTGERVVKGVLVTCGNCRGTGRAVVPY